MANMNLYPPFLDMTIKFVDTCKEHNLPVKITSGLRTKEEQDRLYAQGRTTPGKIVTNAKGSDYASYHQWGLAVDFCKNDPKNPYGDENFFLIVAEVAMGIGLDWAGLWKQMPERCHIQYKGFTLKQLKDKYETPSKFLDTWNGR